MGKLIVIEPGKEARAVDHVVRVDLRDLHHYIGEARCLDAVSLGYVPGGRRVVLWIDDEGLLNDAVPNRVLPSGALICGTMVVVAVDGEDDVPLTEEEAAFILRDVEQRWIRVGADYPKPEPEFRIISLGKL
jgi:hypothetical protein